MYKLTESPILCTGCRGNLWAQVQLLGSFKTRSVCANSDFLELTLGSGVENALRMDTIRSRVDGFHVVNVQVIVRNLHARFAEASFRIPLHSRDKY